MPDLHAQILAWCATRYEEHDTTDCPGGTDCVHAAVAAIRAVAAVHHPHPVYADCGHHDHLAGDPGTVDTEWGVLCASGHEGDVCAWCCVDPDGNELERCGDDHGHAPGLPYCATQRAVAAGLGLLGPAPEATGG